jgi:shikimate 5-dehydrogenase
VKRALKDGCEILYRPAMFIQECRECDLQDGMTMFIHLLFEMDAIVTNVVVSVAD